jgi:hypothetical protein
VQALCIDEVGAKISRLGRAVKLWKPQQSLHYKRVMMGQLDSNRTEERRKHVAQGDPGKGLPGPCTGAPGQHCKAQAPTFISPIY